LLWISRNGKTDEPQGCDEPTTSPAINEFSAHRLLNPLQIFDAPALDTEHYAFRQFVRVQFANC
jgi:hypothetical protein